MLLRYIVQDCNKNTAAIKLKLLESKECHQHTVVIILLFFA